MYQLKRVYTFDENDFPALLADRLWPRGIAKVRLDGVLWLKAVTPSNELRQWLHQDPLAHYDEFCRRYRKELSAEAVQADLQQLRQLHAQYDRLTLLTAAKVIEHSHLPVLQSVLQGEIE
ncbi:DUF488 family protein [Pasteurellaceae bacterium USgator11]|nr:DUF488 family protein [Pasteurellaceae bacterium USgator41]TNG94379.1 DUF488 family protein [Pasteurellaceae bacterium UScroc12]TNG96249.1 DUF488 family protein [Pasteurellaceae bacterium UScroc31]TNH00360.1 DUF488 family protein [Pasteurellaceae bacterium USgator11]